MTDTGARISGPTRLLLVVQRAWSLSDDEMAKLLDYPSADAIRAVLDGYQAFGGTEGRAVRGRLIYSIHSMLARIFVAPTNESTWLRSPLHGQFGGLSPLSYMLQHGLPGIEAAHEFVTTDLKNPH